MSGAIDHSKKETLLGFTLPFTVSIKYATEPVAPRRDPIIINLRLSILYVNGFHIGGARTGP